MALSGWLPTTWSMKRSCVSGSEASNLQHSDTLQIHTAGTHGSLKSGFLNPGRKSSTASVMRDATRLMSSLHIRVPVHAVRSTKVWMVSPYCINVTLRHQSIIRRTHRLDAGKHNLALVVLQHEGLTDALGAALYGTLQSFECKITKRNSKFNSTTCLVDAAAVLHIECDILDAITVLGQLRGKVCTKCELHACDTLGTHARCPG